MPQFDLSFYFSQVFWLCVSFGLLMWAIQGHILPKFEKIRQQRYDRKNAVLEQARKALDQANAVVQETESTLQQTRLDAAIVVTDALKISQDRMQQALYVQHQSYHMQMEVLKTTIESERAHAWKTLHDGVPDLSHAVIQKWMACSEEKEKTAP